MEAHELVHGTSEQRKLFDSGESGRFLFQIGMACKVHVDMEHETVFGQSVIVEVIKSVERAIAVVQGEQFASGSGQHRRSWM